MLPSGWIYPQVIAIEIPAVRIVAVICFFKTTPVCFSDLVPLHGTNFIIPGPIITENDYLTGANGHFFTGKAG